MAYRSLLVITLAACFSPTPPTGVPCEADPDCPAGQLCHTLTRTCQLTCDGCAGDASVADGDGPAATCWSRWLDHTVTLSPPVRLAQLSSTGGTGNPSLVASGLALYVDIGGDLYRASRASLADELGEPVRIDELATPQNESRITTTADDQLAVFGSARVGTVGLLDLWQAVRSPDGLFGPPDASVFAAINTTDNQFDPELSPDGLDLYWAPSIGGVQRIHHARRASIADAFKDPQPLPLVVAGHDRTFDMSISPDQRVIVFGAKAGTAANDLFYATRGSSDGTFEPALELPGLNTAGYEGDPELAADGCTLYFASNRNQNLVEVYTATVVP